MGGVKRRSVVYRFADNHFNWRFLMVSIGEVDHYWYAGRTVSAVT
jgi:hypothetical protein